VRRHAVASTQRVRVAARASALPGGARLLCGAGESRFSVIHGRCAVASPRLWRTVHRRARTDHHCRDQLEV